MLHLHYSCGPVYPVTKVVTVQAYPYFNQLAACKPKRRFYSHNFMHSVDLALSLRSVWTGHPNKCEAYFVIDIHHHLQSLLCNSHCLMSCLNTTLAWLFWAFNYLQNVFKFWYKVCLLFARLWKSIVLPIVCVTQDFDLTLKFVRVLCSQSDQ